MYVSIFVPKAGATVKFGFEKDFEFAFVSKEPNVIKLNYHHYLNKI